MGCDAVVAHEGEVWQYGQGAEVTIEFSGVSYYELFAAEGGGWTVRDGGYSTEADGTWTFGKK